MQFPIYQQSEAGIVFLVTPVLSKTKDSDLIVNHMVTILCKGPDISNGIIIAEDSDPKTVQKLNRFYQHPNEFNYHLKINVNWSRIDNYIMLQLLSIDKDRQSKDINDFQVFKTF